MRGIVRLRAVDLVLFTIDTDLDLRRAAQVDARAQIDRSDKRHASRIAPPKTSRAGVEEDVERAMRRLESNTAVCARAGRSEDKFLAIGTCGDPADTRLCVDFLDDLPNERRSWPLAGAVDLDCRPSVDRESQ